MQCQSALRFPTKISVLPYVAGCGLALFWRFKFRPKMGVTYDLWTKRCLSALARTWCLYRSSSFFFPVFSGACSMLEQFPHPFVSFLWRSESCSTTSELQRCPKLTWWGGEAEVSPEMKHSELKQHLPSGKLSHSYGPVILRIIILIGKSTTGWWFQTFFIFHNIWDNPSHWLSYFSRWLKPPTRYIYIWMRGWAFWHENHGMNGQRIGSPDHIQPHSSGRSKGRFTKHLFFLPRRMV